MQTCDKTRDLPGLPAGGPVPDALPAKPAGRAPAAMTAEQKAERTAAKRGAVLAFLASGEVWTTVAIAAELMQASTRRAAAALDAMERDGLLSSEIIRHGGRSPRVYGITAHGCAVADAFDSPTFERGRINPAYMAHHIDGQTARLAAEAAGWTKWQPERVMRIRALAEGWKKIPDAISRNTAGDLVAIEIERNCKTPKRYAELIISYIREIQAKRYKYVVFICPDGVETLVERSMLRVTHVKIDGEYIEIKPEHRARFKYVSFSVWKEGGNA